MTHRLSRTNSIEFDVGDDRADALFAVLAHPCRRFALQYLQFVDASVSVSVLTTELAAWEADSPITDRSAGERESVELSLLHNHLPRMADAGVVEYDAAQRTVALNGEAPTVRAHLDAMATE